ncbi:MAG: prepilin-type N-terminal cleavage/methylation domain-containing protein [Planctomycetota bacterium]|jgi:prepilin-type N-terminal cleavage/methylation domain-containing protein
MNRKRKGFTLVELLVVIAIIALLMGILMPALARVRQIAFRMVCGARLSGIGRAMLIYAHDYDNDFPRAGYANTIWGSPVNWSAGTRSTAYMASLPSNPGMATVSSSLYLLVKFAEVTPKSYVCKGESTRKAFKASDYITNMEDEEAWDFGPTPISHCSYSYHMPYNRRFLSVASSEPGMAVAADRNPWLDDDTDTSGFVWNDHSKTPGPEIIKKYQKGNAGTHQREGQNVLFMDNHVYFENQSFCGIDEDNIYTYNSSIPPPIQRGQELACGVYDNAQPVFDKDSFLVNECVDTTNGTTTTKGPTCFPADTRVWIDGALEQISRVAAGQNVGKLVSARVRVCLQEAVCLKEIEIVQEHDESEGPFECYDIVLESGNSITVVNMHFVLTDAGQWVDTRDLTSGSKLMSINGPITVTSVVKRATPFVGMSYNLKIKGSERYFVGKDGIVARDW